MPMGILFWVLMILWLLFGLGWGFWCYGATPDDARKMYGWCGGSLLLFILLGLLGWKVFGPVLQ